MLLQKSLIFIHLLVYVLFPFGDTFTCSISWWWNAKSPTLYADVDVNDAEAGDIDEYDFCVELGENDPLDLTRKWLM